MNTLCALRRPAAGFGSLAQRWAIFVLALCWTACYSTEPAVPASVTLLPSSVQLHSLRDTATITAIVKDERGRPIPGVTIVWESSNEAVVDVWAAGLVTARANGSATIAATAGSSSGFATVDVQQVAAEVILDEDSWQFNAIGEQAALNAVVVDSLGEVVAGSPVTFSSLDESVVSVASDGRLTAIGNGEATIDASSGSAAAAASVVVQQKLTSLAVSTADLSFTALATTQIATAHAEDPGGTEIDAEVLWTSSDEAVATVSDGVVTAVSDGVATVSASVDTLSVTLRVAVNDVTGQGRLGFASTHGDLLITDEDVANPVMLREAASGGRFSAPAWSPDGSKIASMSCADISWPCSLYLIDVDGSGEVVYDFGDDPAGDVSWSPDGADLALFVFRRVLVMDANDVQRSFITANRFQVDIATSHVGPRWSPDGTQIAFVHRMWEGSQSSRRIALLDPNDFLDETVGEEPDWLRGPIGPDETQPAWSPDGSRVAFVNDDAQQGIWVAALDDPLNATRISQPEADCRHYSPTWSPDGSKIAFRACSTVHVMNADGSNVVEVPTLSGYLVSWLGWVPH